MAPAEGSSVDPSRTETTIEGESASVKPVITSNANFAVSRVFNAARPNHAAQRFAFSLISTHSSESVAGVEAFQA